jgi:hypothetical protein
MSSFFCLFGFPSVLIFLLFDSRQISADVFLLESVHTGPQARLISYPEQTGTLLLGIKAAGT